jgi:hypothetical protein
VTLIILLVMNKIPGLALRVSVEEELQGIDYDQFNEYTNDYIEYQRDLYETIPKTTSVHNVVTVTPIDNQNVIYNQNDIKMIKIKSIPMTHKAW